MVRWLLTITEHHTFAISIFANIWSGLIFPVSRSKAFAALWYAHLWDMMWEDDDLQKLISGEEYFVPVDIAYLSFWLYFNNFQF